MHIQLQIAYLYPYNISLFYTIKLSIKMSTHHTPQKHMHLPISHHQHASSRSPNLQSSLPSINPETQRKEMNQRTLKKLIDINRQYLSDKVKVGDVRKPSRYAYKLPSKTGHSEYSRIFARSLPSNDLSETTPNRSKVANNLKLPNKGITNYQSTYNMEFSQRKQQQLLKRLQAQRPQKYERKQGPFFTETSYHRDFHPHGNSPLSQEVKPGDHITTGGKFNDSTTYNQHYHSTSSSPPPCPIVHKDHSIFVKIGKPKQSSYQMSYLSLNRQKKEESCKPVNKMIPVLAKIKYRTEYSDKYVEQPSAERGEFQCLNSDQLKNYVLNILNN